jgi:hypothetical protein
MSVKAIAARRDAPVEKFQRIWQELPDSGLKNLRSVLVMFRAETPLRLRPIRISPA